MWLEVELQVKTWILEQRQTGISVSTKMTEEGKGKRLHEKKHWWFLRDAYMVLQLHEERRCEHEDADETCPKASSSL